VVGAGAYALAVLALRVEETHVAWEMARKKLRRRPEPELEPER
jgi:hypothetical protein